MTAYHDQGEQDCYSDPLTKGNDTVRHDQSKAMKKAKTTRKRSWHQSQFA